MPRTFICYRREDSADAAGRIYDRLAAHFGDEQLFMDIDAIAPGEDFAHVIQEAVGACDSLLAVIGRHWLKITDGQGRRRLDFPDDFVRIEIGAALDRGIRIIPVLVGGAKMPHRADLPPPLEKLARYNALEVSHSRFHQDVNRLIQALETGQHPVTQESAGAEDNPARMNQPARRRSRPAAASSRASSAEAPVKISSEQSAPSPKGPGTTGAVEPSRVTPPGKSAEEEIWIDANTQLMWTRRDNGWDVNWMEANEYANGLRLGGYSDWRLPTVEELERLYDPAARGACRIRKPFQLGRARLWSSKRLGSQSAWFFNFKAGRQTPIHEAESRFHRALCVRRCLG
jgi:hypothetical protein